MFQRRLTQIMKSHFFLNTTDVASTDLQTMVLIDILLSVKIVAQQVDLLTVVRDVSEMRRLILFIQVGVRNDQP